MTKMFAAVVFFVRPRHWLMITSTLIQFAFHPTVAIDNNQQQQQQTETEAATTFHFTLQLMGANYKLL